MRGILSVLTISALLLVAQPTAQANCRALKSKQARCNQKSMRCQTACGVKARTCEAAKKGGCSDRARRCAATCKLKGLKRCSKPGKSLKRCEEARDRKASRVCYRNRLKQAKGMVRRTKNRLIKVWPSKARSGPGSARIDSDGGSLAKTRSRLGDCRVLPRITMKPFKIEGACGHDILRARLEGWILPTVKSCYFTEINRPGTFSAKGAFTILLNTRPNGRMGYGKYLGPFSDNMKSCVRKRAIARLRIPPSPDTCRVKLQFKLSRL
jgi:hypothetical protein